LKKTVIKKGLVVAQGVGPKFKPQYCKTNKQTNKQIKTPLFLCTSLELTYGRLLGMVIIPLWRIPQVQR
jgi:glutamine amidotransferase-like uncharacterized protein